MLQNFLNTLSGAATSAGYSNPAANGIQGVPLSATFGKVFNGLLSSFTGGSGIGGIQQQGFGGINPGAIQAYNNAQAQPTTTFKNQALSPGAVLVNSPNVAVNKQGASSGAAALGLLGGLSPLQGFAGQSNINGQTNPLQGNFGNPQFPAQGPFQFFQPQQPQQQGIFGGLQTLLGPIVGLFTFVKSFFEMRKIRSSLNPIQVNKSNIGYNKYQDYISEEYAPGGFDETNTSYEGNGFAEDYSENLRYF